MGNSSIGLSAVQRVPAPVPTWCSSTPESFGNSGGNSSPWIRSFQSRGTPSFLMNAVASRGALTSFLQLQCGSSLGNSFVSARSQNENSAFVSLICRLSPSRTMSHSIGAGVDSRRWIVASSVASGKDEEVSVSSPANVPLQLNPELNSDSLDLDAGSTQVNVHFDCNLLKDVEQAGTVEHIPHPGIEMLLENLEVEKSCGVQKKDSELIFDQLEARLESATDDDSIELGLVLNFNKAELSTLSVDDDKIVESLLNFDKPEEATNGGGTLGSLLNKKEMLLLSKKQKGRKSAEQMWYLFGAVASTTGILSLAAGAILYRFMGQELALPADSLGEFNVPYADMIGTFLLTGGAAVGMEYWAWWAHKELWHADLWHMHESHHRFRDGPFEKNDILAIVNAIPAIALMLCGFFNEGLASSLCFGAGLGMTIYGMAYMFVHDGLVHRRFPVGPVAEVPYLKRVAAAHRLHHSNAFGGVPYGLFLGCSEMEKLGRTDRLEQFLKSREERKTAATPSAVSESDE